MEEPMTQPSPKTTVYITNHNYERFVAQAIESVLGQTTDDWELIVIDDGSSDGSREIIEGYRDHPNVRLVFQEQKGLNVTNNIAYRLARGGYLMRLDADDYIAPEALATMSGVLDRDAEVGLVFPDYYHVDENGEIIEQVRRHDFETVGLLDQPAHGACTMIRKSCLDVIGGYDEAFTCQDGVDIWLRFIEHFEVRNINLPLFYYRRHGNNLTRDESRLLRTRSQIFAKRAELRARDRRTIGVVPVRGRSVDPASMELEPLGGKPLIEWTIDAALAATNLDRVVVTSPDAAVLAHVESRYPDKKVATLLRDPSLASLNTSLEATVWDAVERMSTSAQPFDLAVTLLIESPFRHGSDIDMAVDVLTVFDLDSAVSVRPELDVFYQHHGDGLVPVRRTPQLRLEREELYREAGQIYITKCASLAQGARIVDGRVGHFVVNEAAGLRLSSAWMWRVANAIAPTVAVADQQGQVAARG
jgi:CMP-N-acetylneuraminic acid synthetase